MNRFVEKAKTAFRCFAVSDYEIRILFSKPCLSRQCRVFVRSFQVIKASVRHLQAAYVSGQSFPAIKYRVLCDNPSG